MKIAGRAVPIVFLITIVVINAFAYDSQPVLTDADKKEILSVLFAQELTAAQNEARTILMSPLTNTIWLLELPGVHFKQLTYEEESQVSEYYELRVVKIKRDFVEVWLSKGNYCKKVGSNYQFRKKDGIWKFKSTLSSESFGSGTCVGCKTGSGLTYRLPHPGYLQKGPSDLLLNGKALAIRCRRGEKRYIRCEVDLSLDFSNRSNRPVIILQPHGDFTFWQGGRSLALTRADSSANNYVYHSAAWPSVYGFESYRLLAEALDQPTPPTQVTRTLGPGESWNLSATIQLGVAEENSCNFSVGVEIGWNEIKRLSPLWLRVSYEMWPFNVEIFKQDLGGRLRERWKKYGNLYLEETKSNNWWFAILQSEPIELDFQPVQLNESSGNVRSVGLPPSLKHVSPR